MIINIFTIVGGVWNSKEGWVGGKFAVSQVECLLCCSPVLEDTS